MTRWWLQLIGASDELATNVDRVEWGWTRPAWLLLLLLLVPLGFYIVWRHRHHLPHVSTLSRLTLSTCRIAVLLLLIIVLAGPIARLEEVITKKPILALVLDESGSMALPAGPFDADRQGPIATAAGLADSAEVDPDAPPAIDAETRKTLDRISRVDLARRVLRTGHDELLEELGRRFELRPYTVARGVVAASLDDLMASPEKEDGSKDGTSLGKALDRVLEDSAGRSLAGVVLLSDGRSTAGPEPLEVLRRRDALAHGAERICPVWTVPTGGNSQLADLALTDVLAPAQLAIQDSATVIATVDSHGYDGTVVTIRLVDGEQELDKTTVTLDGRQRQRAELNFTAEKAGPRALRVEADALPEEQVEANNRRPFSIRVDRDKLRLLYLEGAPRWDFRFLDHAMRRDQGLEVTIAMEAQLRASGVVAKDLPNAAALPEDAAGFAKFDAVLLGDISPDLLPERVARQLVRAVEEDGLGLIVQAGVMSMPHRFGNHPLAGLLPVEPDSDRAGLDAPAFAPFRMRVTAAGAIHPALHLYDSASRNRRVWSRMPVFFRAAAAERERRGATVLADFEIGGTGGSGGSGGVSVPLIAERYAGRGRVMYIGTDATFRWRRNIGSHLFYRFWGQAIRHVARRGDRQTNQSWLEVYPQRVEPGDAVTIELYAVDREGRPVAARVRPIQVSRADSMDVIELERTEHPGLFRAAWRPPEAGLYRLTFKDSGGRVLTGTIQAAAAGLEFLRPHIDRDALGRLADASGGELIELEQLHRLPDVLQGGPTETTRRIENELWDNWLLLVLLVGLYCLDVGTRRLLGLA